MAIGLYKLVLPAYSGMTLVEGRNAAFVWAASSADAKALVKAQSGNDINAAWDAATVTLESLPTDYVGWEFEITLTKAAASGPFVGAYTGVAADTLDLVGAGLAAAMNLSGGTLEGYIFTVTIADETPIIVSHTGTAGQDIDAVAAALVVLLNATVPIAGASYATATQILTLSNIADALGDEAVTLLVTHNAVDVTAQFAGTIVDEGIAGAALTIVLKNTAHIFSASYNSGTNTLTTSAAVDIKGDYALTATVTPPAGLYDQDAGITFDISDFFSTVVDEGSAAAITSIVLLDALPSVVTFFRST